MGKRILVVDDDMMNLRMAELLLQKAGYDVVKADSGEKCLEMLKEEKTELILLDIAMPGMDGFQTMKKIRECEAWKEIPVVFLTADMNEESEQEAESLGACGYIRKPFLPDVLQGKVREVLQ